MPFHRLGISLLFERKFQSDESWNITIVTEGNTFGDDVIKMMATLSRPQCVTHRLYAFPMIYWRNAVNIQFPAPCVLNELCLFDLFECFYSHCFWLVSLVYPLSIHHYRPYPMPIRSQTAERLFSFQWFWSSIADRNTDVHPCRL